MQFTVNRKALADAVRDASLATCRRYPLEVARVLCIEVKRDPYGCKITATDLENRLTITCEVGPEPIGEGVVFADAKRLQKALKTISAYHVTLRSEGDPDRLLIEWGKGNFVSLPLDFNPDEYPSPYDQSLWVDTADYTPWVSSDAIVEPMRSVMHAGSHDETRYNLKSVGIDIDTHATPRMVCTDGHRLAVAACDSTVAIPGSGVVMLPLKACEILCKLAKRRKLAEFQVSRQSSLLRFDAEGFRLTTTLIDGEYPQYQNVIPKGASETIWIDRKAFLAALESIGVTTRKTGSHPVEIALNGKLEATLTSKDPEGASGSTRFEVCRAADEPLKLGFNGRYLREALKALPDDEVSISLAPRTKHSGPETSPVSISSGIAYPQCIVMPMRLE
jgi:DNA polymerase-3 subunit beta